MLIIVVRYVAAAYKSFLCGAIYTHPSKYESRCTGRRNFFVSVANKPDGGHETCIKIVLILGLQGFPLASIPVPHFTARFAA